jgi:hypothetical protein
MQSPPSSEQPQPRLSQPQVSSQHAAQISNLQRPVQQALPIINQGQAPQPRPVMAQASLRPCSPPSQRNPMLQGPPQGTNNSQQNPIRSSNSNEPSLQRSIINQNVQITTNTQIMQPKLNNPVEIGQESCDFDQQDNQVSGAIDERQQSNNQLQNPSQIKLSTAVSSEENIERLSPPLNNTLQHIQNKPTITTDLQQQQLKRSLVSQAKNFDKDEVNSNSDQDQAKTNNNFSKSDDNNEDFVNTHDVNKSLPETNIDQESSNDPEEIMDTAQKNFDVSKSALDTEKVNTFVFIT